MGSLGIPELVLIFMIVLLVFGARRLPEAGAGLGKAIRSFKDALTTSDAKELDPPRSGADSVEKDVKDVKEEAHR